MEEGPIQEGRTCTAVVGVYTSSPTVVPHVKKLPALEKGPVASVLVVLGHQGRVEPPFSDN